MLSGDQLPIVALCEGSNLNIIHVREVGQVKKACFDPIRPTTYMVAAILPESGVFLETPLNDNPS